LFLLAIFITFRFIVDMSSGWLGALVYDVITCAVIYVVEKRRIPRLAVVGVILYVLFFQVGKYSVREKYWYQQNEDTKVERIAFWVSESFGKWGEAFNDSSLETLRDLTYNSLSRVALLNQTANVLELTPSTVPYQYGRLYSYMAIALVPRFVWPEKPSVNEANMFYQVAYGITAEEDLEKSSFAIGILTESYINFGWPGVVLMMFLIGIFLDFFQQTFLSGSSGFLLNGLGFVLIPFLLSIDSQLAFYLGGMAQRIFFVLLIFLPIIRFRRTRRRAGSVEQA
jgi:Ca2+/Na+ antiporter